jgi:hypothetical protein
LKACFAKGVKRYNFPDRKGAARVFTHKLADLETLANLDRELLNARRASQKFLTSRDVVSKWNEESRYSSVLTKTDAEEILSAIVRRKDGVLPWIKRYW